jgi:hypothetical protein
MRIIGGTLLVQGCQPFYLHVPFRQISGILSIYSNLNMTGADHRKDLLLRYQDGSGIHFPVSLCFDLWISRYLSKLSAIG